MMNINRLLMYLCLFLIPYLGVCNKKLLKKENKIDKLIELGFLKKAQKENQKFITLLLKKKPSNYEFFLGVAYLHTAQIDAILERDETVFKNDIKQGLDILEKTNFEGKTKGLLRAAEIYIKRGETFKAVEYLKKVGDSDLEKLPKSIQDEYFLAQAQLYLNSKGFQRALNFTTELVKNLEVSNESYYEDKTHFLHLQAKILLEQGYYFQADSILRITNVYLEDLPKKSQHKIDYLFLKAIYHDAIDQPQEVINYLEEAFFKLEKIDYSLGYAKTCYTYEELMEYLCLTHWSYQNEKEGDKAFSKYKKSLKKHFGNKDFVSQQLSFLLVKKLLLQGEFLEAQNTLQDHFTHFLNQEGNDVFRSKILKLKFTIELSLANVDAAEKTLTKYMSILKVIHPSESTIIHLEQLRLAKFYMEYKSNMKQAMSIFNESYFSSAKEDQYAYYNRIDEALAPNHYEHIEFKMALAELYIANNELEKAKQIYEKNIYQIDHYYTASYLIRSTQHMKIGDFYMIIGNYKKALNHFEIAENALKDYFYDSPEYPLCLKKKALYYLKTQDYYQVNKILKETKKAYRRLDIDDLDDNISEFASLYIEKGQYSKVAKVVSSKINTLSRNYGTSSIYLIPEYFKLIELYLAQGNFLEAEDFMIKSQNIIELSSNESLQFAQLLKLQGKMYVELGNYSQAYEKYSQSMKIYKTQLGDGNLEYAYLLQESAKTSLYLTGITKENEEQLINATSIILDQLGENSNSYLNAIIDLATFYLEKKDFDKVATYLEKSTTLWSELKRKNQSPVTEVNLYVLQAQLYKVQKDYANSITYFEKASHIYKSMFDDEHPQYLHTQAQIGKLHYILGDLNKSMNIFDKITKSYLTYIQQNFKILSEKEKNHFWTHTKTDFEFYYTLALSNYETHPKLVDDLYYLVINTKAILLNSTVKIRKQILEGDNVDLKKMFTLWIDRREQFLLVNGKTEEELYEEKIDKDKLIEEINDLEKKLSKESDLFNQKQPVWKDIRKKLDKEDVAIEIVRYRHYTNTFSDSVIYAALITTHDTKKHPHVIFLPNGNDLENKFYHYYTNVVKYELKDEFSYQNYWKPIQEYIGSGKNVYLSLDGIYNRVNVEALEIQNGEYVIDKNRINLIGNTKDILLNQESEILQKENIKATLFGNPDFYGETNISSKYSTNSLLGEKQEEALLRNIESKQSVKPLLGAEKEVVLLDEILKKEGCTTEMYLNAEASENQFKKIESTTIIHVATHGFFQPTKDESEFKSKFTVVSNDGMLNSGLILKDGGYLIDDNTNDYNQKQGIITAYEVMNMNLDNTDLVVLSACETGLGDIKIGEGVYGLQRAFLIAGANSIIMSLFQVSDEATQELMTIFYDQWMKTGNKQDAFYYAKQEVRKKHPNPLYWGSFVLIEK